MSFSAALARSRRSWADSAFASSWKRLWALDASGTWGARRSTAAGTTTKTMAMATNGENGQDHLTTGDVEASGDAVPRPDDDPHDHHQHDHPEVHQHGALIGQQHTAHDGNEGEDMAQPDRSGRQPDHEAHGHDGEVEGRRLRADHSEGRQREQGQVRVHADPGERHEVEHGRADDAQRPELATARRCRCTSGSAPPPPTRTRPRCTRWPSPRRDPGTTSCGRARPPRRRPPARRRRPARGRPAGRSGSACPAR